MLLFLLGVEVGGDERIIRGIASLGVEAALVALAGVAGCALLCILLWRHAKGGKGTHANERKPYHSGVFHSFSTIVSYAGWLSIDNLGVDVSFIALSLLMLCVGIGVGNDIGALKGLRTLNPRLLLLPVVTIAGTLLGCCLIALLLPGAN